MAGWALAISILALGVSAMALPTVFQMYFGKAKIETDYKVVPVNGQLHLVCVLHNPPIKNRFLKTIGVHRETVISVGAIYSIIDSTGNTIAQDVIAGIRHIFEGDFEGKVKQKIQTSIPASDAWTDFAIAYYADGKVMLVGDEKHNPKILPIGKYSVTINIETAEQEIEETKNFVINKDGFGWCG